MKLDRVRYPIGEQSFRKLREDGCVYVDKTHFIPELLWTSNFIFLSRPRRFGKSLLLSTIEAYFRGEKELFDGLWLGEHETEWTQYPVLHFDMTNTICKDAEQMNEYLLSRCEAYEVEYDLNLKPTTDLGVRFSNLIKGVKEKTGTRVVILIDEYDKGILETMDDPKRLEEMSVILRGFYSQPKAMSECVRFCMVTGVARFPNYTLFSGPNNLTDISMNKKFATLCGITQEEMLANFESGIEDIADDHDWSFDDTVEALRLKYDSYRFTRSKEKVYNPFSLLNAFTTTELDDFWVKSGTSKVFVKYLSNANFDLLELQDLWVNKKRMEDIFKKNDSIPLLFQTGYLTIVDTRGDLFRLAIPNGEVRSALVEELIPRYTGISEDQLPVKLQNLREKLWSGDVEDWIVELQSIIGKIPHHLFVKPKKSEEEAEEDFRITHLEATYHIIVNIIFQMVSIEARSEIAVSGGRIDMVIENKRYVYVIEYKLDGTPEEALKQIDEKGYLLSWSADGRQVFKIGIVFSSKNHTISSWKVV
ncbi:MAG: ATP-binding protein [Bacteroidales bacterium]|nr:ATP-binding protein [Bacteroidales bacterium]